MLGKIMQNNIRQDECGKLEYTVDRVTQGEYLEIFMYGM